MSRRVLVLVAAGVFVVAGAGLAFFLLSRGGDDEDIPGPTAERSTVDGFGELAVTIREADGDTVENCLLSADNDEQRRRGLMERRDLGGYDGMIFRHARARVRAFWMRNTPMPLSIAFFGAEGQFVSARDMSPCGDREDCPLYSSKLPAQYAIEVRQGDLASIGAGPGSRLTIDGPCSS